MLRSMTGFGRCVMEDADWTQTWEIRSVNNRHLDLKWRLPLQARGLESRLERVVRRFAARGRMEITLTLQQRGAAANLRFDAAQASAMLDQVAALADLHGDTFEPDYNALFAIPTLWERESEDGDDEMEERLEEGLIAALEDWNESRETEGGTGPRHDLPHRPDGRMGFAYRRTRARDQGRTVRRAPRAAFRSPRRRQR